MIMPLYEAPNFAVNCRQIELRDRIISKIRHAQLYDITIMLKLIKLAIIQYFLRYGDKDTVLHGCK